MVLVLDDRRALGERIRQLRTLLGLSQEALAERSGLHPTQVQRIEQGKLDPRLSTLGSLSRGLGIDLSDLMRLGSRSGSTPTDQLVHLLTGRPIGDQQLVLEVARTILVNLPHRSPVGK